MAREFAKSFYNSKLWKQTRDYVLKRDRYMCVECGEPASDVHHIIELNESNINDMKIAVNPDNLKCLCKRCHNNQHNGFKADCGEEYIFDANGYLVKKIK